jgi:hypothetical protein
MRGPAADPGGALRGSGRRGRRPGDPTTSRRSRVRSCPARCRARDRRRSR